MNETAFNIEAIPYNTCQICHSYDFPITILSNKTFEALQYICQFDDELPANSSMWVCSICNHYIWKYMKFAALCKVAFLKMEKSYEEQTDQNIFDQYNIHKFSFTTPEVFDWCPDENLDTPGCDETDVKLEDSSDFSGEDTYFKEEDEVPLSSLFESDSLLEQDNLSNLIKVKPQEKKRHTNKYKKHRKRHKNGKVIKEGFTSRMVQETNEYTVLKLTKEQVVNEMKDSINSDKYKRALYKCEKCVKGFNFEDVLRNHMEKHSLKYGSHYCDICTQYCPSAVSLRGHMKSHTTRYKCKVCGCVRLSRQHLLEHFSSTHSGDAPTYTCQHCHFRTTKRTVIQRHVRLSHKDSNKNHTCEQCGKSFRSIETLRVHTIRHENSAQLQCEHCTRKFIYPAMLQKHVLSVHINKEFYCVECDIKFTSPDNLRLHFKKSKNHQDSNTSNVNSSRRRRRPPRDGAHAHDRPTRALYVCDICHRTFAQKSSLTRHQRVHTGERPYSCGQCSLNFSQTSTRDKHVKLVHKNTCKTEPGESTSEGVEIVTETSPPVNEGPISVIKELI